MSKDSIGLQQPSGDYGLSISKLYIDYIIQSILYSLYIVVCSKLLNNVRRNNFSEKTLDHLPLYLVLPIKCRDHNQMTTKKICEIIKEAFGIKYQNYWKIIKLKWTNFSISVKSNHPFSQLEFQSVQKSFIQSIKILVRPQSSEASLKNFEITGN